MKVKELIEELKKYPRDAEVITEGCDCYGDSDHIDYYEKNNTICIMRSE